MGILYVAKISLGETDLEVFRNILKKDLREIETIYEAFFFLIATLVKKRLYWVRVKCVFSWLM